MNALKLEGKTILIVDDEDTLREIMSEEMQFSGAKTLEAKSGNEAFKVAKENLVDVIISDVRMENGTGVELLEKIRGEKMRQPVFILVSGFLDLTPLELRAMGADAVFSKPCNFVEVIDKMDELLRRRTSQ